MPVSIEDPFLKRYNFWRNGTGDRTTHVELLQMSFLSHTSLPFRLNMRFDSPQFFKAIDLSWMWYGELKRY
jgi:hypothetical protein